MSFVENGGLVPPQDPPANFSEGSSNNEPIKVSLTGSRRAVDRMIHLMHRHNLIAGSEWSRPITLQKSREVIRVVDRMISID